MRGRAIGSVVSYEGAAPVTAVRSAWAARTERLTRLRNALRGAVLAAVLVSAAGCALHRTARVALYDPASGAMLRGTITVRDAPACLVALTDSLGERYTGSCQVPADSTSWGAVYFGGVPGTSTLMRRRGDERGAATVANARGRSLQCEFLTRWGGIFPPRRALSGEGQCRDDAGALHLLTFSSSDDPATFYTRPLRVPGQGTPRP